MLRSDKERYLSLLFKFNFSKRLSNSLWESEFLLFLEFINTVSILFYHYMVAKFFSNFCPIPRIYHLAYFHW